MGLVAVGYEITGFVGRVFAGSWEASVRLLAIGYEGGDLRPVSGSVNRYGHKWVSTPCASVPIPRVRIRVHRIEGTSKGKSSWRAKICTICHSSRQGSEFWTFYEILSLNDISRELGAHG